MPKEVTESFRVAFLGRGSLGMSVLERLLDHPHVDVPLIVTCRHSPEVGSSEEAFRELADANGIPFYRAGKINQEKWVQVLRDANADLAVAMLWLHLIGPEIIETARHGFLNYHGGLLPRYRGNACQTWAILNGEKEIGLTVHLMDPHRLDAGPVIVQETLPITEDSRVGELYEEVARSGASLVMKAVDQLRTGTARPQPQHEGDALYCYPRLPRDGEIDWTHPADDIHRLMRAAGRPYPGAYSYYADVRDGGRIKKMIVHDAAVVEHPTEYSAVPGHLLRLDEGARWAVVCGDGKLLELHEIEVDGEPLLPSDAFRTVRQRFGLDTSVLLQEIGILREEIDRLSRDRQ